MYRFPLNHNILKLIAFLATTLAVTLGFTFVIYADMGPKPEVVINCANLPDGDVYIDLLVDYPATDNMYKSSIYDFHDKNKFNSVMITALESYEHEEWRPAMLFGTTVPMFGDIRGEAVNGKASVTFSYIGVPNRFKIIAVTPDGRAVVSNVINKRAFQARINFDYPTAEASEQLLLSSYAWQFLYTWLATLLIEGLILLAFHFGLVKNWKAFLIINTITQVFLTVVVAIANDRHGLLLALFSYVLFEFLIILAEAIAYSVFLKEHSKARRIAYAVTANLASFIAGVFMLLYK